MNSQPRFGLSTGEGRPPRVLIVDGNAANAMVAVALARQFGCMPAIATNGEAALSLLRRDGGIDLAILDMGSADREGLVLVQLIRALGERGTMPILGLFSSDRFAARAAGLSGGLKKPYSPRELHALMASALGRVPAAVSSEA